MFWRLDGLFAAAGARENPAMPSTRTSRFTGVSLFLVVTVCWRQEAL
jgi:hypothetical protein